ncbi:hypothetical protein CKM354_000617400 [Cercospora kikuchii]|uniref:Cytochrome P450 n=1 Tax=Cercospora kikuchii TaxID=84275 RepID=A0A9P3CGR3_9PEZI|nr:uncharacterized protein CKM354_000617400 [Cercospora kikuchii]GIZ42927.1 hypothetical protein CKM354_000617400 [Cercospora kikuchii]
MAFLLSNRDANSGLNRVAATLPNMAFAISFSMRSDSIRAFALHIPGPTSCKLSPWTLRWHEVKGDREEWAHALHQKYGDVVLLSPREVSIVEANDIREVYVSHKLDKPPHATLVLEQFATTNLASTRESGLHGGRRKIVAPIYAAPMIVSEANQAMFRKLVKRLTGQIDQEAASDSEGVVNIWPLLRYLAADIMTNIVFGQDDALNSLEEPGHRQTVRMIRIPVEDVRKTFGTLMRWWYPCVMSMVMHSRFLPQSMKGFADEDSGLHEYVVRKVNKFLNLKELPKTEVPTHISLLISKYRDGVAKDLIPDTTWIASDCLDHLFAGSLTTADTLSYMTFEMCRPENYARQIRLREELFAAGIKPGVEAVLADVNRLPYLNCVIKETLRRYPPIPFGEPRLIKPGPELRVGGHFIPSGMTISAQHYSVHRHHTAFVDADTWIPERWEEPQESDKGRQMTRHFWPFSSGPRTCIGQHIAWAEMRLTAAMIFSTYEVSYGPQYLGEDGKLLPARQCSRVFPQTNFEPIRFKKLCS